MIIRLNVKCKSHQIRKKKSKTKGRSVASFQSFAGSQKSNSWAHLAINVTRDHARVTDCADNRAMCLWRAGKYNTNE